MLAIDFGTSNTVAALLIEGQSPRAVTFDASPLLPSATYLRPDGQLTVGRDAQRLARLDPTRFEPNPKRRIDDGEVLLGDRAVPVVQLIAAVLRTVAVEVHRQLDGASPGEVRLTHPAQWGAARQNVLVSAARVAGLGANLLLIAEPVAAAAQFTRLPGRALRPGGTVAVYDLGGGTFDIAVVGRTLPGPGVHASGQHSTGQHNTGRHAAVQNGASGRDGEFHVLAEAGLTDLGGLDFDQAILEHVGRVTSATDPVHWQRILRPADASERRAARALAEDVRAAKETLSRYPQTEITLPDPFVDAHLTRSEFEGLIRPNLLRSIEVLTSVLRGAGIAPNRLGGIFLVGGSSRIPLVAGLIQDRLQVTPVTLDQPETAVALGALLVPVRREGNRTVAMSGGGPPVGGPGPGALRAVGGPPAAGGRTGSNRTSEVSGGGMQPARPMQNHPSSTRSSTGRRSRAVLAGAAALVVLVVLLLILTKPFGSKPAAAPAGTTGASASGGTGPSAATVVRVGPDVSNLLSSKGSGVVPTSSGLGPGKLFSAGEMDFVGPSINRLTNCIDTTNAFNKVVKPLYQVVRAVQCQVAEADLPTQFYGGRAFVYVMTPLPGTGDGGGRYLDQIYAGRSGPKKDSDLESHDVDKTVSAGELTARYVAIYQLPALSADPGRPSSVLGWTYVGRPFVGLVVTPGSTLQDELVNFWAQTYRPRG